MTDLDQLLLKNGMMNSLLNNEESNSDGYTPPKQGVTQVIIGDPHYLSTVSNPDFEPEIVHTKSDVDSKPFLSNKHLIIIATVILVVVIIRKNKR